MSVSLEDHKSWPEELLLKIFSYLPITDLAQASSVCKLWRAISLDICLWSSWYREMFHIPPPEQDFGIKDFFARYRWERFGTWNTTSSKIRTGMWTPSLGKEAELFSHWSPVHMYCRDRPPLMIDFEGIKYAVTALKTHLRLAKVNDMNGAAWDLSENEGCYLTATLYREQGHLFFAALNSSGFVQTWSISSKSVDHKWKIKCDHNKTPVFASFALYVNGSSITGGLIISDHMGRLVIVSGLTGASRLVLEQGDFSSRTIHKFEVIQAPNRIPYAVALSSPCINNLSEQLFIHIWSLVDGSLEWTMGSIRSYKGYNNFTVLRGPQSPYLAVPSIEKKVKIWRLFDGITLKPLENEGFVVPSKEPCSMMWVFAEPTKHNLDCLLVLTQGVGWWTQMTTSHRFDFAPPSSLQRMDRRS